MIAENKQILALFAVVIVASGCASNTQTQEAGSSVISVNTFEASPTPIPSRQPVSVNMELENTGDSTATDVAARIFGPAFINKLDKSERTESFNELRSASDDNPAIPRTRTWTFDTPDIGENREVDYTFYSKIFFNYETRGTTDFRLVSQDRYQEQGYTQSDATIENTAGPINMEIRGTTPKIFYESDGGEVTSEVCIVVENTGEGQAFTGGQVDGERQYEVSEGTADENTVDLTIEETPGVQFEARGDGNSGNSVDDVQLINGEEGYQCFQMIASNLGNEETNINTQVTADYNYVKETETELTVEGRRGGNPDDINDGSSDSENEGSDFGDQPEDGRPG